MAEEKVISRVHAVRRMFQRGITRQEVHQVLQTGEEVESYPHDTPYPSRLLLGWSGSRPLHVVTASSSEEKALVVITVYEPDDTGWESGFRRRRPG